MKINPKQISPNWRGLQPLTGCPRLVPNDSGSISHEEIALRLGVSLQTIRKTEQIAFIKCRRWCKKNGYNLADLLDLSKLKDP